MGRGGEKKDYNKVIFCVRTSEIKYTDMCTDLCVEM